MLSPPPSSELVCVPRFATEPTEGRRTLGTGIARVAEALGTPLMPWQRLVADVGGELLEDGSPAYREVVCTVPRQSGKTTLILAWELHRALMWGRPQVIAYTAQTGQDARKKLVEDQVPLLRRSPLWGTVEKVLRGIADSAVYFANGSRINVLATSEEAGHGKTLDLGVMDEAFADEDFRREQAMLPAMATRHDAQILVFSTAGTEKSVLLNRKVEAGRQAVVEGRNTGIAYFEWSAPEGADPDDRDLRYTFMPALGRTIRQEVVDHARQTMLDSEFRRAYMNLPSYSDERVIPADGWRAVCGDHTPDGDLVLAIDATPDLSSASLVAVDRHLRAELVDHRPGTGWLLARTVDVASRFGAPVVVDTRGPVGDLIEDLEAAEVDVVAYDTRQYAYACAGFYRSVVDGTVAVRSHEALTEAVDGARKRQVGDAWVWARKGIDVDISPLVALTLALDHAAAPEEELGIPTISWA